MTRLNVRLGHYTPEPAGAIITAARLFTRAEGFSEVGSPPELGIEIAASASRSSPLDPFYLLNASGKF
jgi:hypothetical protein